MNKYLYLCLALHLTCCGKFNEKFGRLPKEHGNTRVVIGNASRGNFQALTPILSGGLMVYILRDDGSRQSLYLVNETSSTTVSLPNGNYSFYAYGWDGPSLTSSSPRCAWVGPMALAGTDTSVELNLNNSNCITPQFSSVFSSPLSMPISFVYCGHNTDLTTKTNFGTCIGNDRSDHFIVGNTSGKVARSDYNSTSHNLVFTGNMNSNLSEVFATNVDSGLQRRISANMITGSSQGAVDVLSVPGTSKVLYIAEQSVVGLRDLYVVDLSSSSPPIRLSNHGQPNSGTGATAPTGVAEMRVSSDGKKVLYIEDTHTTVSPGFAMDLWMVDIDGSSNSGYTATPIKISGSLSGSARGIKSSCSSGCSGFHNYLFEFSPQTTNQPYVLWVNDELQANSFNLLGVQASGSGPFTPTNFSNATGGMSVDSIQFSAQKTSLIYHVSSASSISQIWALNLTSPGPNPVRLDIDSSGGITQSNFFIANQSSQIGYFSRTNTPAYIVYTVDYTSGTPALQYHWTLSNNPMETAINGEFSPTDATIVFTSSYSSATTPPTANVIYSDSMANPNHTVALANFTSPNFIAGSNQDKQKLFSFDSSSPATKVTYLAGQTGSLSIYSSDLGVSSSNNLTSAITGIVSSFAVYNNTIYFSNGSVLYSVPVAGGSPTSITIPPAMNIGAIIGIAQKSEFKTDSLILSAYASGQSTSNSKEIFSYDLTNASFQRLSKLCGTCMDPSGLGRFRVSVLGYGPTSAANASGATFTPTIQGGCLPTNSSSDGLASSASTYLPQNNQAGFDSPYSVRLDVFSQATNCNGTPTSTTIFPYGFTPHTSITSSSSFNLQGTDASTRRIWFYVKD